MIPVVTTEIAREIDTAAINKSSIKSYSLMQRAALGVVDAIETVLLPEEGEVAFLCGKGNNGGDAYLAARILQDRGYDTICFTLESKENLSETAAMAYEEFAAMEGTITHVTSAEVLGALSRYEVVVDGLLGTGISGDPRGIYAEAIDLINRCEGVVVTIDIPSGLNGNTGDRGVPTVNADITVILGFPRPAHLFFPGAFSVGKCLHRELGYDSRYIPESAYDVQFFERNDLKKILPPRRPDGNKYTHGTVTVIAGSRGMSGAAALASEAVLRSGAGMCYCIVPESVVLPLQIKVTEPVIISAPETEDGSIAHRIGSILHNIETKTKVKLIGPGLSRNEETAVMVRDTVRLTTNPIVLDGDGLNAFEGNQELFKGVPRLVITPHEGEWKRLFGELSQDPMARIARVAEVAQGHRITIVLKGMPTIVADHNGKVTILQAGNSGMATAGSGDVLAGIISSLIAQGVSLYEAAIGGVAIHGAAGDIAAEKKSEYSLIASDIIDSLGETFLSLEE